MPQKENSNGIKQESPAPEQKISKDDAEHYRYPNSKTPGVHKDSAPIGGG